MDKGLLHFLRTEIARALGITADEAKRGIWWEIDLILVVLAGSVVLGIGAVLRW
jgi:hypothetical protein